MYTTACETCRKVRTKCIRPSRGMDAEEQCERCTALNSPCVTTKRKMGRQEGSKNKARPDRSPKRSKDDHSEAEHILPNPLQTLALGTKGDDTEGDQAPFPDTETYTRSTSAILEQFSQWTAKIHDAGWTQTLSSRLDAILQDDHPVEVRGVLHTTGRLDMIRPDAAPEHDPITLQLLTYDEAAHLFDCFMTKLSHGAMFFDPKLHTLDFVRQRSSFLFTCILAFAASHRSFSPEPGLHYRLCLHLGRLEIRIRQERLKSIEIVQALLLWAMWCNVPDNLSRDITWSHIALAMSQVIELKLNADMPHCVQTDPLLTRSSQHILVRNAHRTCLLLYIRDRNIAMMTGRDPVCPEMGVTSHRALAEWCKHPRATKYDGSLSASVSLRKVVNHLLSDIRSSWRKDPASDKDMIRATIEHWRHQWAAYISIIPELDIIAHFSTFVLTLTLVQKHNIQPAVRLDIRRTCEVLAFDVCCAVISHYNTWQGMLNPGSYDLSMVAFCSTYLLQAIDTFSPYGLSDWSLYRLATIQELAVAFERQGQSQHHPFNPGTSRTSIVMANDISHRIMSIIVKFHKDHGGCREYASNGPPADTTALHTADLATFTTSDDFIDSFDQFMNTLLQNRSYTEDHLRQSSITSLSDAAATAEWHYDEAIWNEPFSG